MTGVLWSIPLPRALISRCAISIRDVANGCVTHPGRTIGTVICRIATFIIITFWLAVTGFVANITVLTLLVAIAVCAVTSSLTCNTRKVATSIRSAGIGVNPRRCACGTVWYVAVATIIRLKDIATPFSSHRIVLTVITIISSGIWSWGRIYSIRANTV
jgi:hypothetical protein